MRGEELSTENRYRDIIDLPHHVSLKHRRMTMAERAAQFAPFSALSGYEDAIEETARITSRRIDLSEEEKEELNRKMLKAAAAIGQGIRYRFIFFVPDDKKDGGEYKARTDSIRKLDTTNRLLTLSDRTVLDLDAIIDIVPE